MPRATSRRSGTRTSITPGVTLYWYPDAPTKLGFYKSTIEPNIAFSYTFEGVKLTPKVAGKMTKTLTLQTDLGPATLTVDIDAVP